MSTDFKAWTFNEDDGDMGIYYKGFIVGSMRNQYDTERAGEKEGKDFDREMTELGNAIVECLNAAKVVWLQYDKSEAAIAKETA